VYPCGRQKRRKDVTEKERKRETERMKGVKKRDEAHCLGLTPKIRPSLID